MKPFKLLYPSFLIRRHSIELDWPCHPLHRDAWLTFERAIILDLEPASLQSGADTSFGPHVGFAAPTMTTHWAGPSGVSFGLTHVMHGVEGLFGERSFSRDVLLCLAPT